MRDSLVSLVAVLLFHLGPSISWSQQRRPLQPLPETTISIPCSTKDPIPGGEAGFSDKELQDAIERLTSMLAAAPDNPQLHFQLGSIYVARIEFAKAIQEYQKSLEHSPQCEDCALALGSLLSHCDQNSYAFGLLEGFLKQNSGSHRVMRQLSFYYLAQAKYRQAKSFAERAQSLDPNDANGHHLLGLSYRGLNDLTRAKSSFKRAIQQMPSMREPHLELGMLYATKEESYPQAVKYLEKSIALGLEHPDIYKSLGIILIAQGKHQQAIRQLEKAVKLAPDYDEPHYLLANAYRKLGEKEKSAQALARFRSLERKTGAKSQDGGTTPAVSGGIRHYDQGIKLFFEAKNPEKAYEAFKKAIAIEPSLDLALFYLAQIDLSRGRQRDASAWIRRAINIDALKPEYYLVLAQSLEKTDGAGALRAVTEAIELKPDEAEFHNLEGNMRFSTGDYAGAARAYRAAIRIDAENSLFHLNLSSALDRNGELQESRKAKDRYRELLTKKDR